MICCDMIFRDVYNKRDGMIGIWGIGESPHFVSASSCVEGMLWSY